MTLSELNRAEGRMRSRLRSVTVESQEDLFPDREPEMIVPAWDFSQFEYECTPRNTTRNESATLRSRHANAHIEHLKLAAIAGSATT